MNLDNIMFIIIFLLLIVILGFLYYMSNNIKKNQNKINILESDVNALRERLGVHNEKMNSIDSYLNKDMLEKKSSKINSNNDPVDFSNFLERISAMNGGTMNGDNEYSEEDSSSDESSSQDDEESTEDIDEESSSSDVSTQYETDESSSDNEEVSKEEESLEVSIDDNVKSESSNEPVKVIVEEVIEPKKEEPVVTKEEVPFIGIDDLMDEKALKKMPTFSIKKLDLGTVMAGGDGKTKYIVSLNKSGKKYWKRN